jgi:hypothetical protein
MSPRTSSRSIASSRSSTSGLAVEVVEDALEDRQRALQVHVDVRELPDRPVEVRQVGHEGDECADREVAADRLVAAV